MGALFSSLQTRYVLAASGAGPEVTGYADPAVHFASGAADTGDDGDDGDDDDTDGAAGEDSAAAAMHGGAPPPGYDVTAAEAALTALRPWNKQWLSVLCKAYLNAEPDNRRPYAASIASMSAVTEGAVVGGYFRAAVQKLSKVGPLVDSNVSLGRRRSIL